MCWQGPVRARTGTAGGSRPSAAATAGQPQQPQHAATSGNKRQQAATAATAATATSGNSHNKPQQPQQAATAATGRNKLASRDKLRNSEIRTRGFPSARVSRSRSTWQVEGILNSGRDGSRSRRCEILATPGPVETRRHWSGEPVRHGLGVARCGPVTMSGWQVGSVARRRAAGEARK